MAVWMNTQVKGHFYEFHLFINGRSKTTMEKNDPFYQPHLNGLRWEFVSMAEQQEALVDISCSDVFTSIKTNSLPSADQVTNRLLNNKLQRVNELENLYLEVTQQKEADNDNWKNI